MIYRDKPWIRASVSTRFLGEKGSRLGGEHSVCGAFSLRFDGVSGSLLCGAFGVASSFSRSLFFVSDVMSAPFVSFDRSRLDFLIAKSSWVCLVGMLETNGVLSTKHKNEYIY